MNKVFISADIEGCCGVTHWDETEKDKADYEEFRQQMTREVVAACEGALQAGAKEIVVRDAHDSARNILAVDLPEEARLIRGWANHPYCMMHGLDSSFDAALLIGYHAGGGSAASPLSHTMTNTRATSITINGERVTEMYINALVASLENVPVLFVSGDKAVCDEAKQRVSDIATCATKEGVGDATINTHPHRVCADIREKVRLVLSTKAMIQPVALPSSFKVQIHFITPALAYKNSFYPGASLGENNTVLFESTNYWDFLCFLQFVL